MLERANDLITYRIDAVLNEIATMSLCDLPDDEPITPEEFLHNTQVNKKEKIYFMFLFLHRSYVMMHQNKFN
jgi:dynein heavy chain